MWRKRFAPHDSAAYPEEQFRKLNPSGLMLSASMMFDWLADRYQDPKLSEVARLMEENVLKSMEEGFVTPDMKGTASCSGYGDHIAELIEKA